MASSSDEEDKGHKQGLNKPSGEFIPATQENSSQIRLSFANLPQVSHRTYGALAPPSTPVNQSPEASTCSPHANETGDSKGAPIPSHMALKINLSLANRGSVARDHLASERTFLAYVRTSLGIASSGVALMQFFNVGVKTKAISQPLGATIIFMAIIVLSLGTRRYFAIQTALPRGQFPISRFGIAIVGFMIGSVITATFGMLLADRIRGS